MTATIFPSVIKGKLSSPPSKSAAHRWLLAAALAQGGHVRGIVMSEDIAATLRGLAGLGACSCLRGDTVDIVPAPAATGVLDCGESASTLRFLLPVYAARGCAATFTGHGRLLARPLAVYADCLRAHGVTLRMTETSVSVSGRLTGGRYCLPGDVSSQFVTGLLLALPLCAEDSTVMVSSPLQSAGYVEMTQQVLRQAGVRIEAGENGWKIPANQCYHPVDVTVERDWSQAAFLLAMGALAGEVTLTGLDVCSAQGDREVLTLFRAFGADIEEKNGAIYCRKAPLHGMRAEVSQTPDLVPILAVMAAYAQGVTLLTGTARLRLKESDRPAAIADGLRRLGAQVETLPDALRITGVPALHGGCVNGYADHRIVMSMAVAALGATGSVHLTDAQSVRKSWPGFFEDFQLLGGNAHVICDR